MKAIELYPFWAEARQQLVDALQALKDEDLPFSPTPGLRTIGENALHITQSEDFWLSVVTGGERWPWELSQHPELGTVQGVCARLAEVHQATVAYLEGLDAQELDQVRTRWMSWENRERQLSLRWIFWHVLEHEVHHRGEIFFAMGMHGTSPPGF